MGCTAMVSVSFGGLDVGDVGGKASEASWNVSDMVLFKWLRRFEASTHMHACLVLNDEKKQDTAPKLRSHLTRYSDASSISGANAV